MAVRVDDVDLVRDRALVQRFQQGDGAAFETLYRRYFARLTRFCQKRVGDPHEAEEIAQEAFTRALCALPSLEGERRFYPWMTVIASRLCVDAHRRLGRSKPAAEIDLGAIEGGQERVLDAAEVVVLTGALERLAPRHREVLDLRERRNWSYQHIADHYGVTVGTVEALLFRARKALRREFLTATGGEGRWAAVPILGLLARPMASWRARLEMWFSALPPLAGPAFSVAVAAAATAASMAGGYRVDPPLATPSQAPLRLEAGPQEPPAAPAAAAPVASPVARPEPAVQEVGPPAGVLQAPPTGAVVLTSAEDAQRRGAEKPHSAGVDGIATVYVEDPAIVASEATEGATRLIQQGVSR